VRPFEYFDKGTMATIGYRSAVADAFGMKFTRFIGYVMWAFIHVLYLIGWGNRLGTVHTWACGIWFGHSRARRIITFDSAKEELAEVPSGRPTPVLPLSATAAAAPSGTPAEGVAAP
jgi:NADH dehydrogenase